MNQQATTVNLFASDEPWLMEGREALIRFAGYLELARDIEENYHHKWSAHAARCCEALVEVANTSSRRLRDLQAGDDEDFPKVAFIFAMWAGEIGAAAAAIRSDRRRSAEEILRRVSRDIEQIARITRSAGLTGHESRSTEC